MVAIGLIVPGGFGVKPPKWFHDRPPQDVASKSSFEPGRANTSTSLTTPGVVTKAEDDLAAGRTTQQAPESAQTSTGQTSLGQLSSSRADLMTIPLKFARDIPAKHFELTGDAQKQSFIKLVLPLILAANDELLKRREAVTAALQANDRNKLDCMHYHTLHLKYPCQVRLGLFHWKLYQFQQTE